MERGFQTARTRINLLLFSSRLYRIIQFIKFVQSLNCRGFEDFLRQTLGLNLSMN
jgi:hypothetical protein